MRNLTREEIETYGGSLWGNMMYALAGMILFIIYELIMLQVSLNSPQVPAWAALLVSLVLGTLIFGALLRSLRRSHLGKLTDFLEVFYQDARSEGFQSGYGTRVETNARQREYLEGGESDLDDD